MCMITRRAFLTYSAIGSIGSALALASGGLAGCSPTEDIFAGTNTIVDSIGRTVELPAPRKLKSIYFTSPLAQIFCFTLAPDLLAGTAIQFDESDLACLPEGTENLKYLGSLSNRGSIDLESLKYHEVQAIFSISGVDLTDVNVSDVLALEQTTGIPGVLIDGSFDKIGDSYRLLGNCLGRQERAESLASYCESVYEHVTSAVRSVPESERVSYYFAEGPEGLQTEPNSSQHSLAFTVAGGVNVAADVPYVPSSLGMVNVKFEQVEQWDPDFIITWDFHARTGAASLIRSSSAWSNIAAVKNDRVFEMPAIPFAFCDRPPGVNRFLGIQWLANLFYPDYYDVDMVDVLREFYARCYWRDISVDQARSILGTSYTGKAAS